MSQENVAAVQEAYQAFSQGDIAGAVAGIAEDADWVTSDELPLGGTLHGRDEIAKAWSQIPEYFDEFSVKPDEFIDAGDRVVMPITARGRPHGSAQTVEVPETQGYTVRNGTIVEVREYPTKAEALKILGLSQWAISQANVEIIRRATDAAGAAHAPDHPDSARTGTGIDGGYPR